MTNSPRHNVGSIADPHWVVDEEHYEKLQAELAAQREQYRVLEDELLVLGGERNAAVAQRDKLAVALEECAGVQQENEYICKCGLRVTPHRCKTGEEF